MFSVENFYYVLYTHLLKPSKLIDHSFHPFGSTNTDDLKTLIFTIPNALVSKIYVRGSKKYLLFYDQEPLITGPVSRLVEYLKTHYINGVSCQVILANSEHSEFKNEICGTNHFIDFYYFYHGFAALDWYKDLKYLKNINYEFDRTFISLNRLCTKERSYRLNLVAEILERNLVDKGYVSLQLFNNDQNMLKDELFDPHSLLSKNAKIKVFKQLSKISNNLTLDTDQVKGFASANMGYGEHKLLQSGLWNIVTETVFYHRKLHLTEKIFKPIVVRRPFILVAAPGNLAYLKSYGFKTFDRWIDESYDLEENDDKRIQMVVDEIEKLSMLSWEDTLTMYEEIQEVLEYNFNHFYGDFKTIIVDELVNNFENCLHEWNNIRSDDLIDISVYDFPSIKKLMCQ